MAWCSCFKTNINDEGGRRKGGNRVSIRSERNEQDLLELNKRGMEPDSDQWYDPDGANEDHRVSHQTDMMGRDMQEAKYEDSIEKAIDDFMKSPRATGNNQRVANQLYKSKTLGGSHNGNNNSSFKKTGVNISKCYQMLCGRCGRRFTKIMILEQTVDMDNMSAFRVQSYFNSKHNHDYECPFCFQKAQIILSEQMLVGDTYQLDYQKTLDKASHAERLSLARQMGIIGSSAQGMGSIGLASGYLGGNTTAASDNISQEPPMLDEIIETRPQLLYTKFQRLNKDSTKLAKVVLVDEIPQVRSHQRQQPASQSKDLGQQNSVKSQTNGSDHEGVSQGGDDNRNAQAARGASHFDKSPQSSKALLYYPEENHMPSEQACNDFNSRIMKHLMKQKMQKNDSFYVSKVLKGDNNFLRRQNTGKSPLTQNRLPMRSSQALANSQSRNKPELGGIKNSALVRSAQDVNMLELSGAESNNMNNSRFVNNHNSTQMAVDQSFAAQRAKH